MKKNCIIIGAGTYGQVYAQYLKEEYDVIAFFDDNDSLRGTLIEGIPVAGDLQDSLDYLASNTETGVFVPIGNNPVRSRILRKYGRLGYETPSFIHESCLVDETVKLGNAVYMLPGTMVMPHTEIGDRVMISMGVNIAHHTNIQDDCFFSQGTNIGASIDIETMAYVGIGATVMTGVKNLGESCLIGAGSVIIRDVPNYAKVVGNPGRILNLKEIETNTPSELPVK